MILVTKFSMKFPVKFSAGKASKQESYTGTSKLAHDRLSIHTHIHNGMHIQLCFIICCAKSCQLQHMYTFAYTLADPKLVFPKAGPFLSHSSALILIIMTALAMIIDDLLKRFRVSALILAAAFGEL